ncbi:MAG: sigma 54-interacting transcriptional regulator [Desulfovibrio sp.]|jgi:PAS domain S-box-containing protein|nr:sigma 54-interacting transcriptional regulator [Desulfovibrio sp.]
MRPSDIFENEKEFFKLILDTMTTGIFVADEHLIVRFINLAYAEYLGVPRESIVGRPITDFIPDSRTSQVTSSGMSEMGEVRTLKNSEGERVIVVNRFPFKYEGKVLGMLSSTVFGSREEYDAVAARIAYLDKQITRYAKRIKSALAPRYSLQSIIGDGKVCREFRNTLIDYARTDLPVLLTGATGTGKELAANAIHCESSRRDGPFVGINCASVPKDLLESELFGYASGAFSGAHKDGKIGLIELADNGTLFLDEIGDTPVATQVKLLRVLEEKTLYRVGSTQPRNVNFRLITATNLDFNKLIAEGIFREDLYYRISVLVLRTPGLHERKEDIPLLVRHILERMGKPAVRVDKSAMEILTSYSWPGNVRELRNIIARALGICKNNCIGINLLPQELINSCAAQGETQGIGEKPSDLHSSLAESELRLIMRILREERWNVSRSAGKLGITRTSLYEKFKKYGISREYAFKENVP